MGCWLWKLFLASGINKQASELDPPHTDHFTTPCFLETYMKVREVHKMVKFLLTTIFVLESTCTYSSCLSPVALTSLTQEPGISFQTGLTAQFLTGSTQTAPPFLCLTCNKITIFTNFPTSCFFSFIHSSIKLIADKICLPSFLLLISSVVHSQGW